MASTTLRLADTIERSTVRKLTMQTDRGCALPGCDPQRASPLYRDLPKEIRDLIFAFATAQYEVTGENQAYSDTAFYARPGHTGPRTSCTNLLLTCRRIWLETYALPLKQAEFTIWRSPGRGPQHRQPSVKVAKLTSLGRKCFTKLHFFLQMYEANSRFQLCTPEVILFKRLSPKILHITIRHTDWFWWEHDAPLKLDDYWVKRILNAPYLESVQEFELELETLVKNKPQLDIIVEKLSKLRGAVLRGQNNTNRQFVVSKVSAPWHWTGPPNINNKEYALYKDWKQLDYHVVSLTWNSIATSAALTDIPEQPAVEARGTHPFPCQVSHASTSRTRPRRLLVSPGNRPLRQRLMRPEWREHPFPMTYHFMERESNARAADTERAMRWRFVKAFGDIEARRLEARWAEQGSLLRFED